MLKNLFPNADPDFLESIAIECEHDEDGLQAYIEDMLAPGASYPTLEEHIRNKKNREVVSFYTKNFNVEDYLKKFPNRNPREYFSKVKTANEMGKTHADHSMHYLTGRFSMKAEVLESTLKKNKYCLVDTVFELEKVMPVHGSHCCHHAHGHRHQRLSIVQRSEPKEINTAFLQEVAYIEHEEEIEDYLITMAICREYKFEQAKEQGMLCQCECCFDTEILADETFSCTNGHLFCEPCLQKFANIRIGNADFSFPCMSADCTGGEFSLSTLQAAMEPREFSSLIRRKQLEDIKKAGIQDVESCPFCGFTNIVQEDSKVFVCLDDECRKESCRKCQRESHIPFECGELEKTNDRCRKFVEDKLSEALIRECYKCHRKFVKENTGCNHITCPVCGAHMCYVCRQPLDPKRIYQHFVGQGGSDTKKCPLFSNANLLHVEALENVAQAVDRELRQSVPNAEVDVSDYLPQKITIANSHVPGAPEQRDIVLQHTMKAVNLNL
ncbi:hypothetical protein M8J75_004310 [Diaphorina citri]|nr:hypothetical protein M8J75_004310 [Diaphorina citri]